MTSGYRLPWVVAPHPGEWLGYWLLRVAGVYDQLMALAITDDHGAQEAAFYDSPQWQRSPQALREHLTAREIDATS